MQKDEIRKHKAEAEADSCRSALLCCAVLLCAVLLCAEPVLCCAVHCFAVLCSTPDVEKETKSRSKSRQLLCSAVLCCAVLCSILELERAKGSLHKVEAEAGERSCKEPSGVSANKISHTAKRTPT